MKMLTEVALNINIILKILYVLLLIFMIFITYYNIMIRKINKIKNALSTIDIMLKKRNDLIPSLVNSVKGMMQHEKMVLEKLIELRNSLENASEVEKNKINDSIDNYINGIMILSENYPSLKSNQNFLDLQKNLRDIEETISAARRTYNAHVTSYNTFISMFPNILFAKLYRFKKYELFKADSKEKKGKIYFNENQE